MNMIYDLESDYLFPVKDRKKRAIRRHEAKKNSGREFYKSISGPRAGTVKRYVRLYEHKVRSAEDVPNGMAYKKFAIHGAW